jgi:GT2 family glycosyltransferase
MGEKTYIIILNYNGWKDTIECLESVLKLNYTNYQIILIDNSESNEDISNIEKWASAGNEIKIETSFPLLVYPLINKPIQYRLISEAESEKCFYDEKLLIVKAKKNKGFAAGNNIGLNYALRRNDFSFCWLLNNDTVVEKDTLLNALKVFQDNKRVGFLGTRLMYYSKPSIIQGLGGEFNYKYSISSHICEGEPYFSGLFSGKIDYPIGASMLITRDCLFDTGTLFEGFFLYYEEIDWAERIKNNNYLIGLAQDSVVYHKEGASIHSNSGSAKSELGDLSSLKSRLVFAHRNNRKNLPLTYLGFIPVIINRIIRFQFNRGLKIIRIIFTT